MKERPTPRTVCMRLEGAHDVCAEAVEANDVEGHEGAAGVEGEAFWRIEVPGEGRYLGRRSATMHPTTLRLLFPTNFIPGCVCRCLHAWWDQAVVLIPSRKRLL